MISLKEHNPELLDEWNYEKNNEIGITPETVSSGIMTRAWWKCRKCGYEWKSTIESRTKKKGTGCPVCGHRIVVEGINDIKTNYPELVKEWDYEKNNEIGLYPDKVSRSSDKKAWWICPICGNSYQTAIKHRTRGTNCPKCANELRTSFPEQAIYYYLKKEFPDTQNKMDIVKKEADIFVPCLQLGIEFDGFFYHENDESLKREKEKYEHFKDIGIKLIRIRDAKSSYHSYSDYTLFLQKKDNDEELEIVINDLFELINQIYGIDFECNLNIKKDRSYIYSQYIFQRKSNSIKELYPDKIRDWDYDKNKISPYSIVPGSEKKVWWKCSKGHNYEQQVFSHIRGASCPYCAGIKVIQGENDLETLYPYLMKEWDYEKNSLSPSQIMAHSHKKAWWICSKGHSFEASIDHRTSNKPENCPYCCNKKILVGYNDLKTLRPELIKEWDYNKNELGPENYTCGSSKKVWWICPKCGLSYNTVIRSRANLKTGCPSCNRKKISK